MNKVLAIDWGTKHIGLAISDLEQRWAFPRGEFEPGEEALTMIAALVHEEEVGEIVLGYPLPLQQSGEKGSSQLEEVQAFGRTLESRCSVPVHLFDERFTSARATEQHASTAGIHERSAQVLLEDYLARRYHGE